MTLYQTKSQNSANDDNETSSGTLSDENGKRSFNPKAVLNILQRIIFQDHNHQSWFSWLYILDWFFAIVVLTLGEVLFSSEFCISPVYHRFLPSDPATQSVVNVNMGYPQSASIVPFWVVILLAGPLNASIFIFFQIQPLFGRIFNNKRLRYAPVHDLHHACLGLLEAMAINLFFTNFFKVMAGRERPDFLSRLKNSNSADAPNVREGRVSFPSGHSSNAFCSMTYLSLYLAGKLKVFSSRGHNASFLGLILISGPIFVAFMIAVTRTMDYHHNFSDIIAGAIVGIIAAFACYLMNYRSPSSKNCEVPKTRHTKPYFRACFARKSGGKKDKNLENSDDIDKKPEKDILLPTIDPANSRTLLKRKSLIVMAVPQTESTSEIGAPNPAGSPMKFQPISAGTNSMSNSSSPEAEYP